MHPIVESMLERPKSQRIGLWVGVLALISYIFWQFLYAASYEEKGKLQEALELIKAQITSETRLARNLHKFDEEVKSLDKKLRIALLELPDKREIPNLLSSISELARDAGLEVGVFRPTPERKKDFYAEVPVEISLAGTFHQLASFFDEVGQLSRIVNISNVEVGSPDIKPEMVNIKASCVAMTFRYLDENERIQKKGGKKKRRKG